MLSYTLSGWKILSVSQEDAAALLELCRREGFVYDGFNTTVDGEVSLRFRGRTARAVLAACDACGLPVSIVKTGGLPAFLSRFARRPGLVAGLLLSVVLLVLSTGFVWDVRVSGNTTLSEREVEETLKACGFGVGSSLRGFRADRTQNRALMADHRLSWISINMRGTVAYVQIREATYPPEAEDDTPANLVASRGGQIVRVELTRGNVLVSAGQWVGEGDLLVSGLYDSEQVGLRYTHAEARVYARTVREITVEIPLSYEQKQYDTENTPIFCEKSLIFFEKTIKFSKKTGNVGGMCDTIRRVSVPFSSLGVGFPISLETKWYLPYTLVQATRTHAEAEELAYLELSRQISAIPGGAEVLSKTITTTHGEDAYVLHCTLTCIEDIAKEQTFEVLP